MSKPTALLLGASGALNVKVLYCLYPVARVVTLASHADNGALHSRHTAARECFDWTCAESRDEAVQRINALIAREGVDIVVPGDIDAAAFAHDIANRIEGAALFPCSSAETLHAIHDKWSFAQRLQAAGLATPATAYIAARDSLDLAAAHRIGFPMMVKPLECESSHGVTRIETADALQAHVASDRPYTQPPLIMQQFIDGPDIDISVLASHGRIIASAVQYWSDDADLVFEQHADMDQLAAEIVQLFGYHGVAHFDMRRDRNTGAIHVLECNPRFWYTIPAAMWCGLNFVDAGIRHTLGLPMPPELRAQGRYRLPGDVVRSVTRPSRLLGMTRANWRGFLQPLLDPLPHLKAD